MILDSLPISVSPDQFQSGSKTQTAGHRFLNRASLVPCRRVERWKFEREAAEKRGEEQGSKEVGTLLEQTMSANKENATAKIFNEQVCFPYPVIIHRIASPHPALSLSKWTPESAFLRKLLTALSKKTSTTSEWSPTMPSPMPYSNSSAKESTCPAS